ncbi:hypothetical protein K8P03_11010 [Anaerococcus murdochii]|uniref:Uncharacterized protein n=1 Tax=Anaerococcus murdochii TaxID=411577 RepID=A0ABS7T215_9FIRM|nr:hypothetical protein [Anaerococcus murdochii]MBZ2387801.1 hypothetical protein [Anaerococcus murdochii]
MTRKRDINDWLLWLMVFRIFVDFHDLQVAILYFVMAVVLFLAERGLERYFERSKA